MYDTYYFILIIIFALIVYLLNNGNVIYNNKYLLKDKFTNTKSNNINISDYINEKVNNFEEKKANIELLSNTPIIKDLPKYKYGLEKQNLSVDMNYFNTQLNMLMDSTLNSSAKIKSNIKNNLQNIELNEDKINNDYVRSFHKYYKNKQEELGNIETDKLFSKYYINDNIDKHIDENIIEKFGDYNNNNNDNDITIKNENNLSIFIGKYFILPYQYKNCNNVYMNIVDNNQNVKYSSEKQYLMSFHLLDDKFIEFDINIDFKNKSLLDKEFGGNINPEYLNNIKGIIITIKRIKPKIKYNYKYINIVNNVKNILNQLGIKPGNKFMFFLVNEKFDTNTKCYLKEKKCESINNDLYRIYNMNGSTLLHLTKKSIIDKPFSSLIN